MDQQIDTGNSAPVGKKIICTNCHIQFGDIVNYKLHLASEFHIYNTKRRMVNLAPISEDIFEAKKQQMVSANASAITDVHFKCLACNKGFKSNQMLDEHKKSKKHKRSEKEYLAKHEGMSQSDIFRSISHSQASIADGSESINANMLGDLDQPEIKRLQVEEDNKEHVHRPTALESTRICLFCNHVFDGVKKCLDHMRIQHNFIILDVDCLVDLKGLLTYMAERIQLGQMCLFCSRTFRDPRRCQQHMIDKGHCMMNMEDEEEYLDFYDFSKTYVNHPLLIKDGDEEQKMEAVPEEAENSWEDCDEMSLNSDEDEVEEVKGGGSDSDDFEIVDAPSTTQSFSIISGNKNVPTTTDGFDIAGTSEASHSNIGFKPRQAKPEGKSKEEVFLGLRIKKAELLPSGEVKLGNGKVIGTRRWHYLYKQKLKLPDERESIIVGKLALEQKKMMALQNGGVGDTRDNYNGYLAKAHFKDKVKAQKEMNHAHMKYGVAASKNQKYFRDPTGMLQ